MMLDILIILCVDFYWNDPTCVERIKSMREIFAQEHWILFSFSAPKGND